MTRTNPQNITQTITTDLKLFFHFLLFMSMGAGANWVFPTALSQEIPYFENTLPEKLCIATYMNATNALGMICVGIYLYIHYYIRPIAHEYAIPSLLFASCIGCFLSAGTYSVTTNGVSIVLYMWCFIGGAIGGLSAVIMNPFMTTCQNTYISACRGGGSAYILLCAFIALIQNPGSTSNKRFSTTIYMIIFGLLLIPSLFSYYYIVYYQIGKREPQVSDHIDIEEDSLSSKHPTKEYITEEINVNPMLSTTTTVLPHKNASDVDNNETISQKKPMETFEVEHSSSFSTPSINISPSTTNTSTTPSTNTSTNLILSYYHTSMSYVEHIKHKCTHWIITDETHHKHPYLRDSLPYMCTVGWVNFNTWGIIFALIPFAMANTSSGDGSLNLSIAYQVGAISLVCGDLSTTMFSIPIFPSLVLFTICAFSIYIAALGGTNSPGSSEILIILFMIQRFLESHLCTTSYRAVATRFPLKYRESASQMVGICDQGFTTIGAIISTLVVTLLFSCSAN